MVKQININNEILTLSFEEVLEKYKGLIVNRCKKYKAYYEFEDMFQMASLGLWKAYERHEYNNGDFTNLAYSYIESHIRWYRQNNKDKSELATAFIKDVSHFESKEGWIEAMGDI